MTAFYVRRAFVRLFAIAFVAVICSGSAWLDSRALEIATAVPPELAECRRHLNGLRPVLEREFASAPESIERERVMKRIEVAVDLCDFVERNMALGDPASLQFAERGLEDLRLFRRYFEEERELWKSNPRNPSTSPIIVNAADFGLAGDGRTSNAAAFEKCLAHVRSLGGKPCIVKIPAGEFLFDEVRKTRGNGHNTQLVVEFLTNVVISGVSPAKTRIVFGVYDCRGGTVDKCENVTLANFEFRMRENPFAEGMVSEVNTNEGSCVMSRNPLAKRPDDPCFKSCLTCQFDGNGKQCFDSAFAWLDPKRPVRDLGDGRFRLYFERTKYGSNYTKVKPGRTICLPDRVVQDGMHIIGGRFVTFDSLWCRNSRSAAFSAWNAHQTTLTRCRIFPVEGCMLSTCADGYYTSSGSYFAHSDFTHMHDDGNNSHSYGRYLVAQEGDDTLYYQGLIGCPKKGDLLLLVSPLTGVYLGNVRAKEDGKMVTRNGKRLVQARFESLPPGLNTFESLGMDAITPAEQNEIVFGRRKVNRMPDHIYVPGLHGVGSVVTDCRISSLRGTAIPSQVPNELIEDSVIENVAAGIHLCGLVQWMEGPPPYHAIVRNNTIRDCGRAMSSLFCMPNHVAATNAPMRGCRFERNRVMSSTRTGIEFQNLGHSVMRGNSFTGDPVTMKLRFCENLDFCDNTLNGHPLKKEDFSDMFRCVGIGFR